MTDEAERETGKPSISLTRNAKGDTQIVVKVYAEASDDTSVGEAERIALETYQRLERLYPMRSTPPAR